MSADARPARRTAVPAIPHARTTTRLPLVALLLANAISQAGNMVAMVAIPWYVLETTGSAGHTGLAGFMNVVPLAIAGFVGGAVVDRLGDRRTSVISDAVSCLAVALIPLLHAFDLLSFPLLLALIFAGALLDPPGSAARGSMLPDLAERAGLPLERVNAIAQLVPRAAILVGPPLAGLLIATAGTSGALWLNAASFLVSALLIGLLVPASSRHAPSGGSYLDDLRAGVGFLRAERTLLSLIATFAVFNLLLDPLFAVILPVYARRELGSATQLGLMVAAFGGGAVAGVLLYGVLARRIPRRVLLVGPLLLAGLPLWIVAAVESSLVTLVALALMGLAIGPISPAFITLVHERTPAALRGRVLGTIGAVSALTPPVGILLAGLLVEWLGIRPTLLLVAGCYLALSLAAAGNPAFRRIERAAPSPALVAQE